MFTEIMNADPGTEAPGRFPRFSPLLVRDLDGDGLSEIVTAGCNLVYKNEGNGRYTKRDFLKEWYQSTCRSRPIGPILMVTASSIILAVIRRTDHYYYFLDPKEGQFIDRCLTNLMFRHSKDYIRSAAGDIDGDMRS